MVAPVSSRDSSCWESPHTQGTKVSLSPSTAVFSNFWAANVAVINQRWTRSSLLQQLLSTPKGTSWAFISGGFRELVLPLGSSHLTGSSHRMHAGRRKLNMGEVSAVNLQPPSVECWGVNLDFSVAVPRFLVFFLVFEDLKPTPHPSKCQF